MTHKRLILLPFLLFLCTTAIGQIKNIALNKPVTANSVGGQFTAQNAVDGKITRLSKWMSGNVNPPHILEIDLQRYCNIDRIVIHTGIPQTELKPAEASQAPGFWSAKNFRLQYWDDANWTDIPRAEVHENRMTEVPFSFSPAINTFKIRFVCDDGEPISLMEMEVFGTETDRMAAMSTGELEKKEVQTDDREISLKVGNRVIGKSMKYVGYNQGYYLPGSNVSGWMEYSGVNSVRVWTSLNSYVPVTSVQVDPSITSVEEFDKRKNRLRQNPEKNEYIHWECLLPLYANTEKAAATNPMVLNYVLDELKRLKIDPLLQINSTDFNETWSNKWQQWQRFYALAFYAAKTGDVTMFAMQNEPNHRASGPMELSQWISGMQIVSDAVRCAIEDVNKMYGKKLIPRVVGPVTAGNNPEWWAAISQNITTDYHGKRINEELLGIFSTHSYNSPAAGYASRVREIRKIIYDNHPLKKELPVVFTEIGRWMNAYLIDKEETMDSPSLFTEWAGIYAQNTLNGGYGQWAFKFSNTISDVYAFGVKSGHHFTWQGRRIIEDAYENLAKGKKVTASFESGERPASLVADGDKSDSSAWHSDSVKGIKWVEIDLGAEKELGSAVVYTGSADGVYTAPDRVRNYSLQFWNGGTWQDIPGFTLKENKYAQVFKSFKEPVMTAKIRFLSEDPGVLSVREIKLFAKGDGPSDEERNFDVSGIQRTGEVVRLFAKGFRNERPLYETASSVEDNNLDALTSFDETTGNYHMWLVQRGHYTDRLTIDLSGLPLSNGTPVTAETVGRESYGEVTTVETLPASKTIRVDLKPQSVTLLTIPSASLQHASLKASACATAHYDFVPKELRKDGTELRIALNASERVKNKVAYAWFDLSHLEMDKVRKVILRVNGQADKGDRPFLLHTYGIPSPPWDPSTLNYSNAPLLDKQEPLIREVGRKAFVAGEMAFTATRQNRMLDVTDLVRKHGGMGISFAFVRETRQMGDDSDKGREVILNLTPAENRPSLEVWSVK